MEPALRLCLRIGNAVLLTFCCFLLANIANQVSAALLEKSGAKGVELPLSPVGAPEEAPAKTWRERILDRNLFGAALIVTAPTPEPEPEQLEKTELPLELAGTVASDARSARMASIWNQKRREYQVLRPGDRLEHHPEVELARVERGRVVLRNGDELEELLLADRERDVGRARTRAAIRDTRNVRRIDEMRRAVRAAARKR